MMNLKGHKGCNSGFMLMEILMALTVVSMLVVPVFSLIRNALFVSARYRDQKNILIVMKNFMMEKTYKAKTQGKKEKSVEQKRLKEPMGILKYTRSQVKNIGPFKSISKEQLKHLWLQKVEGSFGDRKDRIVSFLYKPLVKPVAK